MKRAAGLTCIILFVSFTFLSLSYASTALIAEVMHDKGEVKIKQSGSDVWEQALPLQSISEGDVIIATEDSYAVIIYSNGEDIISVNSDVSPYTIKGIRQKTGKITKAQTILNRIADFITGKKSSTLSLPLAVRSLKRPPAIISPKDSIIYSASPLFEWIVTPRVPCTIRILDGEEIIWEAKSFRARISYPDDAPLLSPGTRYQWVVETPGYPPAGAWFRVTTGGERRELQEALSFIGEPGFSSLPVSTKAVLRYRVMKKEGFISEGRRLLSKALLNEPDSPILHLMLGDYYESIGIKSLADEEYDEADFLINMNK